MHRVLAHMEHERQTEIQRVLAQLLEAKAEHQIEINHLKASYSHVHKEIDALKARILGAEAYINARKEVQQQWRFPIIEFARQYWHVIGAAAALLSCVLAYLGIKISRG